MNVAPVSTSASTTSDCGGRVRLSRVRTRRSSPVRQARRGSHLCQSPLDLADYALSRQLTVPGRGGFDSQALQQGGRRRSLPLRPWRARPQPRIRVCHAEYQGDWMREVLPITAGNQAPPSLRIRPRRASSPLSGLAPAPPGPLPAGMIRALPLRSGEWP